MFPEYDDHDATGLDAHDIDAASHHTDNFATGLTSANAAAKRLP